MGHVPLEISLLARLSHPNIVKVRRVISSFFVRILVPVEVNSLSTRDIFPASNLPV